MFPFSCLKSKIRKGGPGKKLPFHCEKSKTGTVDQESLKSMCRGMKFPFYCLKSKIRKVAKESLKSMCRGKMFPFYCLKSKVRKGGPGKKFHFYC